MLWSKGGLTLYVGEANSATSMEIEDSSKAPSIEAFSERHDSCSQRCPKTSESFHSQEESLMKAARTALMASVLTLLAAGTASAAGQPPVQVPMPPSLGLLVTGLVGLAGAGWWMRRK
jgi:hypothetical protein